MKPLRKNVALAIDGGGIRGVIVAKALIMLEQTLNMPSQQIFQLTAGTSTGAILAAGIASGFTARQMFDLYVELGADIFPKTWRSALWPLTRYRYENEPFLEHLRKQLGDRKMGDFWAPDARRDVIITCFDMAENRSRFIKPWKDEYRDWPVVKAVLASSTVPTYFPVVDGRYVDGGVGSYANPSYLAAYEIKYCLNWDLSETTLISLGTGRSPYAFLPDRSKEMQSWEWLGPVLGAFAQSADDQQTHLVDRYFPELDYRRFQIDLSKPVPMDAVEMIPRLAVYGDMMGRKILNDQCETFDGLHPHGIEEIL